MLYRSYIVVWIFVEASAMSAVRLAGQWTYLIHHGSYKSQFTCKSQTRLGSRTFLGNVTVSTLRLIDTWRFVRDHKSRSWAHDGVQREWEGKHTIGKYGLYSGQCRWMMMLLNSCKFCGLQQVRASWFETSMLSTVYGQITVLQYDICACGPLILRKATTPSQMGRQSAAPSGSTDENALATSCHFSNAEIPYILTLSGHFHHLASHVQVQPYSPWIAIISYLRVLGLISYITSIHAMSSNNSIISGSPYRI